LTVPQTRRIFISYRRDDSAGYAGRIYDRLAAYFGKDSIFMDVDTIEAGLDFVEVLENAVKSCDVLVALIGRQWLNIKDAAGNRRLDNPQDFVRIEVAAALKREIRVIPVLVDGTLMPGSEQLPSNLESLARRNAVLVNHHSFHTDADRLIEQLELALNAAQEPKILIPKDLFISYSKKDSNFAFKLADDLISAGYKVWINRSLQVGEDWSKTNEANLAKASGVIVILSSNSITSNWVQHEVSIAYGLKKPIYPLLISELHPDDLPVWAGKFQYHSFVNVEYQAAFDSLVNVVTPVKNPMQILINLMAALLGGIVGGFIGGAITYYAYYVASPQGDITLGGILLGSMLVPGVWYSVPISVGISACETFWRKNKLLPIIGGAIMGLVSGFLLDLLLDEPSQHYILECVFGGGIALSIIFGRRYTKMLQIPIWALAGALTGWIAAMSAPLLNTIPYDSIPYVVVSLGVTVAIGLASSRS